MQSSNSHSSTFQADNEDARNSQPIKKPRKSTASSHRNDSRNKNKRQLNSSHDSYSDDEPKPVNDLQTKTEKKKESKKSLKKSQKSNSSSNRDDKKKSINKNETMEQIPKQMPDPEENAYGTVRENLMPDPDPEENAYGTVRENLMPDPDPEENAYGTVRENFMPDSDPEENAYVWEDPDPEENAYVWEDPDPEENAYVWEDPDPEENAYVWEDPDPEENAYVRENVMPDPEENAALHLTPHTGSIEEGAKLFDVLIKPIPVQTFMQEYWEQKPLLIQRKFSDYYKDLISTEAIVKMLQENHVEFTKHIEITQYKDGAHKTLNPVGSALPSCVRKYYGEGCSIRILNPQIFLPKIHSFNATLQEYFQCMVGANVYLSPENSQGFAPHYDDTESFVVQIEGKNHWRIYKNSKRHIMLPCESSKNFDQHELGKPCLDVILEAGDLLYFPRGYIHQATTTEDCPSLHITVSVYKRQTYGDLLDILYKVALKEAISENIDLRRGLPTNIWQDLGVAYSDSSHPRRDAIVKQILSCFETVSRHVKADSNLDNSVDQMALRYQHDALPPKLTPEEELRTVYGTTAMVTESGDINYPLIALDTKIRLTRANVLRMVQHGDEIRVYYSSYNSKEYHEFEENYMVIEPSDAPAVKVLTKAYPSFVRTDQLQLEHDDRNLKIARNLWKKGILMTEDPLP